MSEIEVYSEICRMISMLRKILAEMAEIEETWARAEENGKLLRYSILHPRRKTGPAARSGKKTCLGPRCSTYVGTHHNQPINLVGAYQDA